jgi:uncharacterized repeat protein (TIGR02543 family)
MKRIVTFSLLFFLAFTLAACDDNKSSDDTINVIFFTANTGANLIESYLNVEPGSLIEEPANPTRGGFVFDGWFQDIERTIPWDFDADVVGDFTMILYAKWSPEIYNIIYDWNGGSTTSDYATTFVTGDRFTLPTPRRTGYTFVAWYTYDWEDVTSTIPGDKGLQILPDNQVGDLYLYAHWIPVSVSVTFGVNYPVSGEGPANPSSFIAYYGDEIDFPVLEDTADYIFIGWNSRRDGTGTFYVNGETFLRTQRVTVYGIWQAKE